MCNPKPSRKFTKFRNYHGRSGLEHLHHRKDNLAPLVLRSQPTSTHSFINGCLLLLGIHVKGSCCACYFFGLRCHMGLPPFQFYFSTAFRYGPVWCDENVLNAVDKCHQRKSKGLHWQEWHSDP